MTIVPRWYQTEAVDAVYAFFAKNFGSTEELNPLVCMPTGTGKSLVIAMLAASAVQQYPRCRVLMVTHVKELIEQNAEELLKVWPGAPLGIVSAGLGRADWGYSIMYAGIGSISRHHKRLGHFDLVLIDEAHLLSPSGDAMYQKLIAYLKSVNPFVRIIGFTATAYRNGIGELTNNGIFTHIAYDITGLEAFNRLVRDGYLAPLLTKQTQMRLDTSGVAVQAGEYNLTQLQDKVDTTENTRAAVHEMMYYGQQRQAWLLFCSGVKNAENAADCLQHYGVPAAAVHGDMSNADRDAIIRAFKNGELRAITNNNVLTTGFNHRPIDLIGMLRPTKSTGLWVQMLGRGTRPSPETGKANCLVLDYAQNALSLGPINDPVKPRKKGKGTGEAPVWTCPMCQEHNHARAPYCVACGYAHDMTQNLAQQASTEEVMRSDEEIHQTFKVNRVFYFPFEKEGYRRKFKAQYACGVQKFSEFIDIENPRARYFVEKWWNERSAGDVPATVDEALDRIDELKEPARIRVHVNTHWPKIVGVEF